MFAFDEIENTTTLYFFVAIGVTLLLSLEPALVLLFYWAYSTPFDFIGFVSARAPYVIEPAYWVIFGFVCCVRGAVFAMIVEGKSIIIKIIDRAMFCAVLSVLHISVAQLLKQVLKDDYSLPAASMLNIGAFALVAGFVIALMEAYAFVAERYEDR